MMGRLGSALFLALAVSGKMIVEMSRALDTCDAQDVAIDSEGTTRLVYAYSDKQPIKNVPTRHTHRGTQSLRLASPGQATFNPPEKNVTHYDIAFSSYKVPFDSPVTGADTTYYCGVFPLPKVTQKRHIIRFEPFIMPKINVATVHHILIYECNSINATLRNYRGHCYGDSVPQDIMACNGGTPFGAWAVGGVGTTFPDHLGYPMKPLATTQYVLMEIHYNNPNNLQVVDMSGMRFYTTAKLRQYDAGIVAFGHTVDGQFTIPADKQAYKIDSYCPGSCTSQVLPTGGIKIVAALMHAHLAGRALNFTLIRGGKEIGVIMEEKYYDFNLQDFETLASEVTILPGDTVRVQCTYNTKGRTEPTQFGLSTHNEMCLAYALYYPSLSHNTTTMCVYANFSNLAGDASGAGNLVSCFGEVQTNVVIPPYKRLQATACKRTPIAANRLGTKFDTLKGFQAKKYANSQFLDAERKVKLYWTLDRKNNMIRMAAEVNKTVGWMGLGISPNGGMIGADIAMAWVNRNSSATIPRFTDRFAAAHRLPAVDARQDFYDVVVRA